MGKLIIPGERRSAKRFQDGEKGTGAGGRDSGEQFPHRRFLHRLGQHTLILIEAVRAVHPVPFQNVVKRKEKGQIMLPTTALPNTVSLEISLIE